ncbi:MAG TPA: hypothetical protein VIT18_07915, partial [Terrimicrobiaceae bacterium]
MTILSDRRAGGRIVPAIWRALAGRRLERPMAHERQIPGATLQNALQAGKSLVHTDFAPDEIPQLQESALPLAFSEPSII